MKEIEVKKIKSLIAIVATVVAAVGGIVAAPTAHAAPDKPRITTINTAVMMNKVIEERHGRTVAASPEIQEIARAESGEDHFVYVMIVKDIPAWTVEAAGQMIYVNENWLKSEEDVRQAVRVGIAKTKNGIRIRVQRKSWKDQKLFLLFFLNPYQ